MAVEQLAIPDADVTDFVFEHAEERGEKPALIDGPSGRTVTYDELGGKIAAMRGGLAARGFGKGDALGIYLPNLPAYAIAFHAAASAGGRATTANPLYTDRELAHQLEDCDARLLLTVPPLLETARAAAERAGVEEIIVTARPQVTNKIRRRRSPRCSPPSRLDRRDRPGFRSRRSALLERHHRCAEGGDALAPQPGRQPDPDRRGAAGRGGRHAGRLPAPSSTSTG